MDLATEMQKIINETKQHSKQRMSDLRKKGQDPSFIIDRDTNIGDLAISHPHIADIMANDYELHCASCYLAGYDTLFEGSKLHGMTEREIDDMIDRLNKINQKFLNGEKYEE